MMSGIMIFIFGYFAGSLVSFVTMYYMSERGNVQR